MEYVCHVSVTCPQNMCKLMGIIMKKHSKKHPKTSQIHQKVDLEGALGGEGGVALWGVLLSFKKAAKKMYQNGALGSILEAILEKKLILEAILEKKPFCR